MFPDQVIYTVNADVGLLNAIFNGVAMVCNEHALVWGFAMLASVWRLVAMTSAGALRAANGPNAGTGMTQNAVNLFIPFLFAMTLTSPQMKTKVTVESSVNGTVTSIDNVPFIISALPATASLVSQKVGEKVETAMQGSGTDYASLSASGKGFINPLKTLLTSRTAVLKMGTIQTQVGALITGCLGADANVDYGLLTRMVMNAGNSGVNGTGASSAQSLSVFAPAGTAPTAIGALLYQAAQNHNGYVENIDIPNGNHILSCADAAALVGANINDSLYSPDFKRAVQGAVNSADVPHKTGDFTITSLSTEYTAVRTANAATNVLAGGVSQANAEMINLLFSEMLRNELNCIKANGPNKTACLAMTVQANEIERNNIQAAANGVEALLYAGQFSNYITALIIGLGPVIIMFMMFAGMDSVKNMKAAAHMIVWPLLIMNVGAELINAMIYNSVANFMTTIAQDGFITQAVAAEVYKSFSLKIGTASHLIATLPILMTTIFALGQSAALVKISDTMGPNSKATGESATPPVVNSAPLLQNSSMAKAEQGIMGATVSHTGASDAIHTTAQFASMSKEASRVATATQGKSQTISEGEKEVSDWRKAFRTGDYSKWNLNKSEGDAIRDDYVKSNGSTEDYGAAVDVKAGKSNNNQSMAAFQAGASAKLGTGGAGAGISIGANGQTSTGAQDQLARNQDNNHKRGISDSAALSKALSHHQSRAKSTDRGGDRSKDLSKSLSKASEYSKTLSETKSLTDTTSDALKEMSGFVQLSSKIGSQEISNATQTNRDYARFQLSEGRQFDQLPAAQKYREKAERDMAAGAFGNISGNDLGKQAAVRHAAAVWLANDETASTEDRFKASKYVADSAQALQGIKVASGDTSMMGLDIADPRNAAGVDSAAIVKAGNALDPATAPKSAGGSAAGRPGAGKPQTLDEQAQAVREQINGRLADGQDVKKEFETADAYAKDVGLGEGGNGTVVRTAKNVAANATGGKSRTSYDTLAPVIPEHEERTTGILDPMKRPGADSR